MLILVEGGEGVGKSHLAARLAEALRGVPGPGEMRLSHYGPPERHPLLDYCGDRDWYRPGSGDHEVMDRGHLSEAVYGERYRGGSTLGPAGHLYVEAYLKSRGAVLVYLSDSPRAVAARLAETRDADDGYMSSNSDAAALSVDFENALRRSTLPVLRYGFAEADVDEVLAEAANAEASAEALAPFPTYVGPVQPRVLLLGEARPGAQRRADGHESCFAPYPDCSGRYLFETLGQLAPDFAIDYGVANAVELGPAVPALVDALGGPAVVALGTQAHLHLAAIGVPHGTCPHPQYHRRFHWHRPRLLRDALRRAEAGETVTSYDIPPAGEGWEEPVVSVYDQDATG